MKNVLEKDYKLTNNELKILKLLKEFGCEKISKVKKELYGYTNSPYDNWGATISIIINLNEYEFFVNQSLEFEFLDKLNGRSVDIKDVLENSIKENE